MPDHDEYLVWDLVRTARLVERRLIAVFEDLDLTPSAYGVLDALARSGRQSQRELASAVLVRPQTMNVLITSLIERGLIARDGPAGSGRRTAMTITAFGHQVLAEVLPQVRAANSADTLHLDEADGLELARILALVRASLR